MLYATVSISLLHVSTGEGQAFLLEAELSIIVCPISGCWSCDLQLLNELVKIQEPFFVQAPFPSSQLLQSSLCVTLMCVTAPPNAFCMNTSWYKYSELSWIDPVGKATALFPGLNSSYPVLFCHDAELVKQNTNKLITSSPSTQNAGYIYYKWFSLSS